MSEKMEHQSSTFARTDERRQAKQAGIKCLGFSVWLAMFHYADSLSLCDTIVFRQKSTWSGRWLLITLDCDRMAFFGKQTLWVSSRQQKPQCFVFEIHTGLILNVLACLGSTALKLTEWNHSRVNISVFGFLIHKHLPDAQWPIWCIWLQENTKCMQFHWHHSSHGILKANNIYSERWENMCP